MAAKTAAARQKKRSKKPVLLGHTEPRIFTPPLRRLTKYTSLGFMAIDFAESIGFRLYPWQKWVLIHALELAPGVTLGKIKNLKSDSPLFRFRTVILLVARQQGKSLLSQVLALFFLYVLGVQLVIGTAQDLDTAEEIWDDVQDTIDDTPGLAELALPPLRANGKKTIRLKNFNDPKKPGPRYKVKAANRGAGRGLSGDLIMMDELREHLNYDAWGALTKTAMARPKALIYAMSNAGDVTSVPLRMQRLAAHKALGDPDGVLAALDPAMSLEYEAIAPEDVDEDSTLGLFEYSAPPGCDIWDRSGWQHANPSMGYGLVTERSLAAAAGSDPEWVFRTECLCQWSEGTLTGLFPPDTWERGWIITEAEEDKPQLVGELTACVDVAYGRAKSHIVVCGRNDLGNIQIELAATRAGTAWISTWLADNAERFGITRVCWQGRGAPVSGLFPMDELPESLEQVPWQGPDLTAGTESFYDAVVDDEKPGVFHFQQPLLDLAAKVVVGADSATGTILFDRKKSPGDVAPLIAAAGAYWLFHQPREEKFTSAYEGRGLLVI